MNSASLQSSIFPDISALAAPSRMAGSVEFMRQELRLPLEYIKNPDEEALVGLAGKITLPADNQSVIRLAHRLSSRDINWIFPLLLYGPGMDKIVSDQLAERISLIIRERASLSFYVSGWLCFQYSYPNQKIADALSLLGRILDIRQQSGMNGMLPIINEIASPDARQFTKQLTRRLNELNITLKHFMQDYGLAADLPLGAELISQAFLRGSGSMLAGSHGLFAQVLRAADQETQIKLLKHFFSLKDLKPAVWNRYCQLIYRQFGEPEPDSPVWGSLKKKYQQAFNYWIKAATIGSHCHNRPRTAHLYLRHANLIEKIESWDSQTLIISFPGFYIADSQLYPDLALCYDSSQSEKLFARRQPDNQRNPASPDIPRRRVDEAIRRESSRGIVGLPLDEEGIRYSEIFLDMCLHGKKKTRSPRL